ncbi:MAG TPA: hypothetical protein VHF65_04890 [Nitrososphaera sp.]|nr:hypothetical protein [Nitrososphaera sp.]
MPSRGILLFIIFVLGTEMKHLKSDNNSKVTARTATFLLLATILIVAAGVSSMPLTALASRSGIGDGESIDSTTQLRSPRVPVVVSGDNIYIAWGTNNTENGNQEVMFRASNDGGATFSNRTNLSNSTDADSWRVEIAGEGETVVVSWWETNQTSDIPVAKVSTDGGGTFGPMLMLGMNGTISGIEEEEGEEATEEGEGEDGGEASPGGVIEEAVGGPEVAE